VAVIVAAFVGAVDVDVDVAVHTVVVDVVVAMMLLLSFMVLIFDLIQPALFILSVSIIIVISSSSSIVVAIDSFRSPPIHCLLRCSLFT